ncbi:ABC transporter permease [Ruminococcus sp.]|uniref:ABC transporter permease n=1 Tax=Ruminococcus sp. TaxID=41978 RepID=UPI00388DDA6B
MEKKWTAVIEPSNNLMDLKLKEVWRYKDLIWLFVQRDFKTRYKQTLLGPLWFIVQPLFTTIVQTFVFGNLAGLPTDGVPQFLFYMAGNVPWLYFSTCLTSTSNTFVGNAGVFGKVYFPRLTTPIATVISSVLNFLIQFVMFLGFTIYFMLRGSTVHITWVAALTPLLILEMAMLGMGFGIIVSSLTTKYRDLQVLVGFGVSLWMYATPIIYAASSLSPKMYTAIMLNPMSPIVELMRYGWLGSGTTPWVFWGLSWIVTFIVLFLGIIMFNKVEKTFMDTV